MIKKKEGKNFYFRYFLPRLELWALLSGLFGFFFVLARSRFEAPGVERMFIFFWLFYMLSRAFFVIFFHGGARFIGLTLEHRDARIINTHIVNKHIDPKISDRKLKEIFQVLKKEPVIAFKRASIYSGGLVFMATLTMYLVGTSLFNLIVILVGGLISVALLALFSIFSIEISFVNDLLKECRKILKKRDIKPDEEVQLFTLENRFNYFIFLLFLVVVTILSFVPRPSYFILIILSLAFIMIAIISRMLFSSIYAVFQEINGFMAKLPRKERAEYYTGSSYKEVLDLSKNLNKSAKEIFETRTKEKRMRKELQEKVKELNRWFRVTVGRELKMVELKKEIEKLKEKENK